MLIDKENIMLEAGVEMGLEAELTDDGIVVAVDMSVDTVHAFEYLADHAGEGFGEWDTWVGQ